MAHWKQAYEKAKVSASAEEHSKEAAYWKKEAKKYQEQARVAEQKHRESLPTQEYVDLVKDLTTENMKLKAQNSELQEFKIRMGKFTEEQQKYVVGLDTSIKNKMVRLNARRTAQDYPVNEDFALEAEIAYENDLRDQAKSLDGAGPDAFMPTLKISFENFTLKKQVKALEERVERALKDADLIKEYDNDRLSTGMERLTRGELVLMNRKLSDDVQQLLKYPPPRDDYELF